MHEMSPLKAHEMDLLGYKESTFFPEIFEANKNPNDFLEENDFWFSENVLVFFVLVILCLASRNAWNDAP